MKPFDNAICASYWQLLSQYLKQDIVTRHVWYANQGNYLPDCIPRFYCLFTLFNIFVSSYLCPSLNNRRVMTAVFFTSDIILSSHIIDSYFTEFHVVAKELQQYTDKLAFGAAMVDMVLISLTSYTLKRGGYVVHTPTNKMERYCHIHTHIMHDMRTPLSAFVLTNFFLFVCLLLLLQTTLFG